MLWVLQSRCARFYDPRLLLRFFEQLLLRVGAVWQADDLPADKAAEEDPVDFHTNLRYSIRRLRWADFEHRISAPRFPVVVVVVVVIVVLLTFIGKNIVDFTSVAHQVLIAVSTITSVSGH